MLNNTEIRHCLDVMRDMFPNAECELTHENPFELVIAVLLSAQCTDVLVNKVTSELFKKYKEPEDYLAVTLEELQQDIRSIGLYRNKAKNIRKLCQSLLDDYGGEVPSDKKERKRTRLDSSHVGNSDAVLCLKKKKQHPRHHR